jgi:hypothetical protein
MVTDVALQGMIDSVSKHGDQCPTVLPLSGTNVLLTVRLILVHVYITGDRKFRCSNLCQINYVNLECGTRRRRFREADTEREVPTKKAIITAEFQLQVSPKVPSGA